MNTILLIIALVLAIIAALLGFGTFHTDGDPHILGWLSASLAFYYASLLAPGGPIPWVRRRE